MTNATKEQAPAGSVTIVGPSAPEGQDVKDQDTFDSLASMRSVVVSVGKRMGTITGEDPWSKMLNEERTKHDEAFKERAGKGKKKGKRTRYGKAGSKGQREAPQTNLDDDDNEAFGRSGIADDVIIPPFDFVTLCHLLENSSALRQNIDAMATNVHGFGHRFEPVLDFSAPEIDQEISDILLQQNIDKITEGMRDLLELTDAQIAAATPDPKLVSDTRERWKVIAMIEKARAKCFFDFLNPLTTFTEVRKKTGFTRELLGNSAWEVLREKPDDVYSPLSQVYPVPFVNLRLLRTDRKATKVKMLVRKDAVAFEEVDVDRFFRRFVRITGTVTTYYKEFGDPRVVSRKTGDYYESLEELEKKEPGGKPANEIFHWKVDSEISAYGIPRWTSALLSVLGSRAAEEVNFLYFDNKAIPPMVLLVSGGRVSEQAVDRLESYFNERVKGRANFHKIMIIEGVSQEYDETSGEIEHSGKLRLELKPLMQEMQQDALFQNYDQNNIRKVGRVFRQPQLLTGDTADMNRSTAEVAKAFAEEQIYQPERDEFDGVMDRHFMTNLRIHFWRFVTNAPVQRFPNDLINNMKKSLDGGAITPNEARKFVNDAFNADLPHRSEEWADTPPKLSLAGARVAATDGPRDSEAGQDIEGAKSTGLIGSGHTSEEDGHTHPFVVMHTEDGKVAVIVRPVNGHTHLVEDVEARQGAEVEVALPEVEGHSHGLEFVVPVSEQRKRASQFMNLVDLVRRESEQALEEAKDDFFGRGRDE